MRAPIQIGCLSCLSLLCKAKISSVVWTKELPLKAWSIGYESELEFCWRNWVHLVHADSWQTWTFDCDMSLRSWQRELYFLCTTALCFVFRTCNLIIIFCDIIINMQIIHIIVTWTVDNDMSLRSDVRGLYLFCTTAPSLVLITCQIMMVFFIMNMQTIIMNI